MDKVGLEIEASFGVVPLDRTPFDRIDEELRRQLHNDIDRLLNNTNRIWNKSFRDQEQTPLPLNAIRDGHS